MKNGHSNKVIQAAEFKPINSEDNILSSHKIHSRWLLLISILIFIFCLIFLLTAKSVQINTDTITDPEISISGLAIPLGNRYLIREGSYQMHVSAPGYEPLKTDLSVSSQSNQTVQVPLRMLPGKVSITSDPSQASITLDGKSYGSTPLEGLALENGKYEMRIQRDRYLTLSETIDIKGRAIEQKLNFTLHPAWADITVNSSPPEASILVDEVMLGQTPDTVPILDGIRAVTLRLPGYADFTFDLNTKAGEPKDLGTIDLIPASGVINVTSLPTGANVSINAKFLGQAPLQFEVEPDMNHRLVVSLPGHARIIREIQLNPGDSETLSLQLRALSGEIHFFVNPKEAEVIVNGKSKGFGNLVLSLPATPQRVEVRHKGYRSKIQSVTPVPDFPLSVNAKLLTEAEARIAHLRPSLITYAKQKLLLFNPAGLPMSQFTMGASRSDPGRRADERLQDVRLVRTFYLQTTEVTNAQFRLFEQDHNSGQIQGASLNRERQPAVQVNWQQAAQYCNWLSRKDALPEFYIETNGLITGHNPASNGYRLPTEAEWAWATRVNENKVMRFAWGDAFPPPSGERNYADEASAYLNGRIINGYNDNFVVSAPVGSFPANHRKLFDLDSNVAEWMHDVYKMAAHENGPLIDPLGEQDGDNRVIRGASWAQSKLSDLRLSARDYGQMGRNDVGFRIARYAE